MSHAAARLAVRASVGAAPLIFSDAVAMPYRIFLRFISWMSVALIRTPLRNRGLLVNFLVRTTRVVVVVFAGVIALGQLGIGAFGVLVGPAQGRAHVIELAALEREAERRYQSIEDVHAAVAGYLESIWPGRS